MNQIVSRHLYVEENGNIHRVSRPVNWVYKAIAQLSGKRILHVSINYTNKNRKPYEFVGVDLNRWQLDENGSYDLNCNEYRYNLRMEYDRAMYEAEREMSSESNEDRKVNKEIPRIPRPPVELTRTERKALTDYLKEKYPLLWRSNPSCLIASEEGEKMRYKGRLQLSLKR